MSDQLEQLTLDFDAGEAVTVVDVDDHEVAMPRRRHVYLMPDEPPQPASGTPLPPLHRGGMQ